MTLNINKTPDSEVIEIQMLPIKRTCPFDPPPEYRFLRAERPILKVRTPRGDIAWLITKFEDISALLMDKRLSSDPRTPGFPTYIAGNVPPPPGFFLQNDAPDHIRLRRAVTQEFTAAHVETLRPKMQKIIDQVIDNMLKLDPPLDLMSVLAIPIASQIICELLGVPIAEYPLIKECTDTVLDRSRSANETEVAAIKLMECFDKIVSAKEKNRKDDLLSRLITHAEKENQLSHEELVGLAALLLLSAYDTMALAIGLGTVMLLKHPKQLIDFLTNPSLATALVNELVRYLTINHTGLPRAALEDIEIDGHLIRAGDGVLLMLSSGNRDESKFSDADSFNIHRKEHSHLGFGHGLHKCLGVHFAYAELQIVFYTLFQRIPSLKLAIDVEEMQFRHEMVLYGLKELPITWFR